MLHLVYGTNSVSIDLREPHQIQSPSLSSITHRSTSSSSSPSSLLQLASFLTRSVFHYKLKPWLFDKSFPPWTFSSPTGLIPRTLVFISLNGLICLHGVLVGFRTRLFSVPFCTKSAAVNACLCSQKCGTIT